MEVMQLFLEWICWLPIALQLEKQNFGRLILVSCLIFMCGSVSTLILLSTSGFLLFNCCVFLISNLTLVCLDELKRVVELILQHVTECVWFQPACCLLNYWGDTTCEDHCIFSPKHISTGYTYVKLKWRKLSWCLYDFGCLFMAGYGNCVYNAN
jgi:hypothetical protein